MEHANFGFKIKTLEDDGSFTGWAATYGNVDLGNDMIEPGAFSRTLNGGKKFPLLWQHRQDEPIGTVEAIDTSQGLMVKGQLLLSDPTAMKAYRLLKAQVIKGLSIGYDTVKDSIEDGVRHLKELRLWEVSCVTFPMNEMAMVTGVKALSDDDRAKHLKAIDSHRKTIDRSQRAIRQHLKAMFDGLDDEDDSTLPDDSALLESDEGDGPDEDMSKAFLVELQKLAEQAQELA